MKKILILAALVASVSARAAEYHSDAPVVAAKLYHLQAELTRRAKVTVDQAGKHRIIVTPLLSSNINDISPTVTGAKLVAQGTHALFRLPTDEEPLWQKIDDAKRALNTTQHAVKENSQFAKALIDRAGSKDGDIDQIQSTLTKLRGQRELLLKQQAEQQKTYDALKAEADWLGKQRETVAQTGIFDIYAEQAGEVELTFQEKTTRANWSPYSAFYLDSSAKTVRWQAGAQIMQNTGLDWHDVALTLALTPLNYIQRPELQAPTVAVADRIVNKETAEKSLRLPMEPRALLAAAPQPAEMEDAYSLPPLRIFSTGLDFNVQLPGDYDLASGGDRYQVHYLEDSAPADVYSGVYSWSRPVAVVVGEWTQPAGAAFIPGETSIYRDGNHLVSRYLGEVFAGGAKQSLSFGQDTQIEVNFHTPPGYTAGSGIILKDKILEQRENVHIKNLADGEKNVRIYARIPVATQQEVNVEGKFNPPPTVSNADDVKGIYVWQKTLPPAGEMNVESGYDIRYPDGKRLIGLD